LGFLEVPLNFNGKENYETGKNSRACNGGNIPDVFRRMRRCGSSSNNIGNNSGNTPSVSITTAMVNANVGVAATIAVTARISPYPSARQPD